MLNKESREKILRELLIITEEHGSLKAQERIEDLFIDSPRKNRNELQNLVLEFKRRIKN